MFVGYNTLCHPQSIVDTDRNRNNQRTSSTTALHLLKHPSTLSLQSSSQQFNNKKSSTTSTQLNYSIIIDPLYTIEGLIAVTLLGVAATTATNGILDYTNYQRLKKDLSSIENDISTLQNKASQVNTVVDVSIIDKIENRE